MITQLDLTILDWIQAHLRCGLLDTVMPLITLFGEDGIFWIVLSLALLIIPKTRRIGLTMCVALAADVLLCNILIKPIVARPRPWTFRPGMEEIIAQLTSVPGDFSFPSGHTAIAFAGAGALLFQKNRWGIPAVILAALIGLSRLYLFCHYPTDVLCGALLGLLCGAIGVWIGNRVWAWYERRKKPSPEA